MDKIQLNEIEAASYTWNFHQEAALIMLVYQTAKTLFEGVFRRYSVTRIYAEDCAIRPNMKETYAGQAVLNQGINVRHISIETSHDHQATLNESSTSLQTGPDTMDTRRATNLETSDGSAAFSNRHQSLDQRKDALSFHADRNNAGQNKAEPTPAKPSGQTRANRLADSFSSDLPGLTSPNHSMVILQSEGGVQQESMGGGSNITGVRPLEVIPPEPSPEQARSVESGATHRFSKPEVKTGNQPSIRDLMGGKGMFLLYMKEQGIPVPDFYCVKTPDIRDIEDWPVCVDRLLPPIPIIQNQNQNGKISLNRLKNHIAALTDREQRKQALRGMSDFMTGASFYQAIKDHPAAQSMKQCFDQLCQNQPDQKIIVRSSGTEEDRYGDAQAGKYESLVHNNDDVVKTCLKVLASGYRPEVCETTMPSPMALVMQHCVDCQFGGVAMSYTSLKDNTVQVEYVPGQPKGAVAGQFGITPHRYSIIRKDGNTVVKHTAGNIPKIFRLEPQGDNTADEKPLEISAGHQPFLPESLLRQLYQRIETLENLLNCPVDVEFGIDQQAEVKILQVRPVTRLRGSTKFALAPPSEYIARGTLVSEGVVEGPVIQIATGKSNIPIPEGAIISAHHGEDWMLTPEISGKVRAFIFQQGGLNDHVAITLRQAGIPCLIIGADRPLDMNHHKRVTLVCGEFNGHSGAFVLGESRQAFYLNNTVAADSGSFTAATAQTEAWQPADTPPERVDLQFQWLHAQNSRLLRYFNQSGLLHQCISGHGNLLLSIAPRRREILLKLKDEVTHLLEDTKALLHGYERYLRSGASGEKISPKIASYLENLETLKGQFDLLEQRALTQLDVVLAGLTTQQELPPARRQTSFAQWQADCRTLQENIQKLSFPRKAETVNSIHDVIFLVHKSFVDALGDVAVASGQGEKVEKSHGVTFVNFNAPGMNMMLDEASELALEGYGRHNTVLNMEGVSIINTDIYYHKGIIELVENGPGDKGRLLRVRMIDNFNNQRQFHFMGKLKRFLLLALQLNAVAKSSPVQGVSIEVNEAIGEIAFEINNVPDIAYLRRELMMVIGIMNSSSNKDDTFSRTTAGFASVLDFPRLKSCLASINSEDIEVMHQLMVFDQAFLSGRERRSRLIQHMLDFYGENSQFGQIINFAETAKERVENKEPVIPSLDELTQHPELIRLLFIIEPKTILPLVQEHTDWLRNKTEALSLVQLNGKLLEYCSCELKKDKAVVMAAVAHSPYAVIDADSKFWENSEILSTAANTLSWEYSGAVKFLGRNALLELFRLPAGCEMLRPSNETIKLYSQDSELLLEAINHSSNYLLEASDELKDNQEFMKAAITINPGSYFYASQRLQGDKSMAWSALQGNYEIYCKLPDVFQNDPEMKQYYRKQAELEIEKLEQIVKNRKDWSKWRESLRLERIKLHLAEVFNG